MTFKRRAHLAPFALVFLGALLACSTGACSTSGEEDASDSSKEDEDAGDDESADSGLGGSGEGTGTGGTPAAGGSENVKTPRILAYSRTTGFRHDSINSGLSLLAQIAAQEGWEFMATEDPGEFTASLESASCVVFLNTTGDILDDAQQGVFESWFQAGGAFVGIHAAADTEYDWDFYGQMVGAYFDSHPQIQAADVVVEDGAHPATAHLSSPWNRTDEWYNYQTNPRQNVQVLLTLSEASYEGGQMGSDHPISWAQELGAGRSFYTGFGHTDSTYEEPHFVEHLRGALYWVQRLDF